MSSQRRFTDLLTAASAGDSSASSKILPLVYDELRGLARRQMANEKPGQTLQPTALVHEAYLRLVGRGDVAWNSRGHFYCAAAQAMRRILIERARRYNRLRHGAGRDRVPLDDDAVATDHVDDVLASADRLLDLDAALVQLEKLDQRKCSVVMLRYFAGMSIEETARALDVSPRTVKNDWSFARAWLATEMKAGDD